MRGRRLQETALQRQTKMYAPDVIPKVEIEARKHRLSARFIDPGPDSLACGEIIDMVLRVENIGSSPVSELWLIHGPMDEIWVGNRETLPGNSLSPNVSS